jgi:hypothetical protein
VFSDSSYNAEVNKAAEQLDLRLQAVLQKSG